MPDPERDATDTVLLVEDDRVNQLVSGAMLERLGFAVDIAAEGAGAVYAAAQQHYCAILMDCQMPGLDGYAATAAIREHEGDGPHTPIIAVTATVTSANRKRGLDAGMDDYLEKPLGFAELGAAFARCGVSGSAIPVAAELDETPTEVVQSIDLVMSPRVTHPVLDPDVVERLEHLGDATGEHLMLQLAALFLTNADRQISLLHTAVEAHDAPTIAMAAHTMRGASANVGATDLARRCAWLETHATAGDLTRAHALLDGLMAELGRVRAALEPWTRSPIAAS